MCDLMDNSIKKRFRSIFAESLNILSLKINCLRICVHFIILLIPDSFFCTERISNNYYNIIYIYTRDNDKITF